MLKWAETATAEVKTEIGIGLNRLAEFECVTSYHPGPDLGVSEGNWDYMLVGDFVDEAAYRQYADEEGHLALIADLIRPNITARAAVQYEV